MFMLISYSNDNKTCKRLHITDRILPFGKQVSDNRDRQRLGCFSDVFRHYLFDFLIGLCIGNQFFSNLWRLQYATQDDLCLTRTTTALDGTDSFFVSLFPVILFVRRLLILTQREQEVKWRNFSRF